MIQKKICLIGAFSVGKTSLVSRLVQSIFSEKYHTTVGVKVDRKTLTAGGQEVGLMIWDIAGEDSFRSVDLKYLRGASGCLIVADGTRRATLDVATALHRSALESIGDLPFILLVNKADLADQWEITDADLNALAARGWRIMRTSAKTNANVETAFTDLAEAMLAGKALCA